MDFVWCRIDRKKKKKVTVNSSENDPISVLPTQNEGTYCAFDSRKDAEVYS